jgi:hypothetical protein
MRSRVISIAFLSGLAAACTAMPHTRFDSAGEHHSFACIDGVEYFDSGPNPTPHLKPDGKPYTCNY